MTSVAENPVCTLLIGGVVLGGIEAGIGAGAAVLFTSMSPGVGAIFGAIYGVVNTVTFVAMRTICGPKFAEKNYLAALAISVIVTGALTVGIAALLFLACGVAFTAGSLFIVVGSLMAVSVALSLSCFLCGTALKNSKSPSSLASA